MTIAPRFVAALCVALAAALSAQGKIKWETDFDAALERAKKENKLIVACVSMKGERVCDVIVDEHYCDSKILKLSKNTVNLFCSPHGTAAQKTMEQRLRTQLLKKSADDWIVAPQHVIFSPDGQIVSSVPYFLSVGELEWLWAEALKKHDPNFQWKFGERARAPARLKKTEVKTSKEIVKPPTKRELDKILRKIKRESGTYHGAKGQLPIIVRHPGSAARKFVERFLKSLETSDSDRVHILQTIGANSPRNWFLVVTPMLNHEHPKVRAAAARALRDLGERKAVGALMSRWRKEKSNDVRGEMLRAMAVCGPTDVSVIKLVPFVVKEDDNEDVRVQAVMAVAALESRDAVTTGLRMALEDGAPRVRATAAYAIASRRDTEVLAALKTAISLEEDKGTKTWMEAAAKVMGGGSMDAFQEFLKKVAKIPE